MILVDTSVWVEHLRRGDDDLARLLETCQVLVHPFVIGELACGNLSNRDSVLTSLEQLPSAQVATHTEVMAFVTRRQLSGRGVGWIDMHLLASVVLTPGGRLWTHDRKLAGLAAEVTASGSA